MKTLVRKAKLFDGVHEALRENANIVIEDGKVVEILEGDIPTDQFDKVISAEGKVVIPGLVDNHIHITMTGTLATMAAMTPDEYFIRTTRFASEVLRRGFTTVRDAGGMTVGLKASIDNGYVEGPRIFPSNAALSQTSGHSDMRFSRADIINAGGHTNSFMRTGGFVLADGVAKVLEAVRQQLFLGASQIKIMAGGGMSSSFDPLRTLQYTFEEMKAAVDAATDYGTYVMAHIYTPQAMQRAAKAGVRCFEHATLMDDETARIMQEKGIWLCVCPQFGTTMPKEIMAAMMAKMPPKMKLGREAMIRGLESQAELVGKYDLPMVFGTDAVRMQGVGDEPKDRQLADFRNYKKYYGSYRGLKAATGNAYELSKLTTYQNPYPDGKIGVLEPGSYADLLIVEGNPVEDLDILCNPDNIQFVMKGGAVVRDDRGGASQ